MSEPRVTFAFGTRGLARVKRDLQSVLDIAGGNAATAGGRAGAPRSAGTELAAQRAALIELAQRHAARRAAAEAAAKSETATTAASVAGAGRRSRAAQEEGRAKGRAYAEAARAGERAEQGLTRATEREARRREASRASRARAWGQRAERFATEAYGVASSMHGQIQNARRSRADTEHTLNSALYQAGVTGAEASGMRARVFREVESGRLQGLSADEVAQGLVATQAQFSSLTRGTRGLSGQAAANRRDQNLSDMLSAAEFARNTYQGPGEVMRVAGMLSSQGVTGDSQRATLEAMTGIAQAGSIELANVTREALGPLMQNIAVATARLGTDASPEARAAAVREATVRTLAVGEVGAGAGLSARDSLNAYAKIQRNMQSDVVTGRLFEALGARRGGSALARELFTTERDSRGQTVHRMRAGQDALGVMGRLQTFAGGSTQLANLLQGGGGEAMILDAQVRRFLGALSSQTAGGQSMSDRVQDLYRQGLEFGQRDVERGRTMVNAEQRTQITAQDERRNAALTMDTAATRFSNAVDRFSHENPFAAAAVGAAAPNLLAMVAGRGGAAAGGIGGGGSAGAAGAAGIAGRGAAGNVGVAAAALAGLALGDKLNDVIKRNDETRNRNGTVQDTNTFSVFNDGLSALVLELRTLPSTLGTVLSRGGNSQAAAQAAGVARAEEQARQRRS